MDHSQQKFRYIIKPSKHHKLHVTFPIATADVAMSRTKLSPSLAGAAKLMGLVPKVHYKHVNGVNLYRH